jgi:glycine hydroxymethyltransferase
MCSAGLSLVTGGSDNHLQLVDLTSLEDVSGKRAEQALESVGITANKNTIPGERRKPTEASGLRVGTPAVTTRGFTEGECTRIGELIGYVLSHLGDEAAASGVHAEVEKMLAAHPLYPSLG